MRKNPIYQCIHSAHFEHNIIGAAPRLGSLYKRIQEAVPSTTGVNMPISGAARSHCYISVKNARGRAETGGPGGCDRSEHQARHLCRRRCRCI